jgi:hypothetical protein
MFPVHFLTGTGTPALTLLKGGQDVSFYGGSATNNETSTTIYLKLWWQGNTNVAPIIGTTAPTLTIAIPAAGWYATSTYPLIMSGPCYYAVTKLQADTDDTALSTGGEAVTLFIE